MDNIQQGYYYSIKIQNIKLSLNQAQSTLYLLALVTSFQIDSNQRPQDIITMYKGKYYMDYDGFGSKQQSQTIKYLQQDSVNPIFISIYLYDAFGQFGQYDSSQIFANYDIQISQQTQDNFCAQSCNNGDCNYQFTGCNCLNSVNEFYFDSKCQLIAKAIYINNNIEDSFVEDVKYYYIQLSDPTQSFSLIIDSKQQENGFSFVLYNATFNTFSIPNYLNNYYNFKSSSSKEILFNQDLISKTMAQNDNKSFSIIFGLRNNIPKGTAKFNLQFRQNNSALLSEEMPNWAMYLFAGLAVLGLLFMIFVIFSIIRAQYRGANGRNIRVRNIFVAPDVVEKYMPVMFYKEIDIEKGNQEECTICMEGYKDDNKVRITICGHLYHSDCLDKWLVAHTSCPYCRQDLTEKELETWLQNKICEQMQKQQLKDFKEMMVQFLSDIEKNDSLKNILKICHNEQKQKRSYLSISNNKANLKKGTPDASSVYSNQTAQITQIPQQILNKNKKSQKLSKKNQKLHSQSFNLGADLDVDFKNLMNDNILNSQSSNRKGLSLQKKKQKNQEEDDFNMQSNILIYQNSQDNFNLLFKKKTQKNQDFIKRNSLNLQQNKTEINDKYELEGIQEDLRESHLRNSHLQTQINSNQNLQRKNFKQKKRNGGSQASLQSIEFNQMTSHQNIDQEIMNASDKMDINPFSNNKQINQFSTKNQESNDSADMNASFGNAKRKSQKGNFQVFDDFQIEKGSEKTLDIGSKKEIQAIIQIEQNSSLNNCNVDETHQSLKAYDNYQAHKTITKGYPQEINEIDNHISQK